MRYMYSYMYSTATFGECTLCMHCIQLFGICTVVYALPAAVIQYKRLNLMIIIAILNRPIYLYMYVMTLYCTVHYKRFKPKLFIGISSLYDSQYRKQHGQWRRGRRSAGPAPATRTALSAPVSSEPQQCRF